jgi:hypothetical protein
VVVTSLFLLLAVVLVDITLAAVEVVGVVVSTQLAQQAVL